MIQVVKSISDKSLQQCYAFLIPGHQTPMFYYGPLTTYPDAEGNL